jgi:hypothetical protein
MGCRFGPDRVRLPSLQLLIRANLSTDQVSAPTFTLYARTKWQDSAFSKKLRPNGRADCHSAHHEAGASLYSVAGAMGGALVGSPRQERIFPIASGGLIAASIRIRPPQRGQSRMSNPNTRAIN